MAGAAALAQKRVDGAIMRNRRRIEQTQGQALAKELSRYFLGMVGRLRLPAAARGVKLQTKAEPSFTLPSQVLDWSSEEARLLKIVHKAYINVSADVIDGIADAVGVQADFGLKPVFDKDVLKDVAAGVKDINIGTRSAVAGTIRRGLDAGSSPQQIAKQLVGQIEGWGGGPNGTTVAHSRAMVVARTETAIAYNRQAISSMEKSGVIKQAKCLDAPDCGWTSHSDPDLAAGKIVSFDEARAHPVAHPNCVRAFSPVISAAPAPAKPKPAPRPKVDNYANPHNFDYAPFGPSRPFSVIDRKVRAWASTWIRKAQRSDAQRTALRVYQGSGYNDINGFLRGDLSRASESVKRWVADLDSAMNDRLPTAFTLRRGVNYSGFGVTNATELKALTGKKLVDPGYFSTAVGPGFAKQVHTVLEAPKGQKGVWMNAGTTHGHGDFDTNPEFEFLLPRNTTIRVDKVVPGDNGSGTGASYTVFARILE